MTESTLDSPAQATEPPAEATELPAEATELPAEAAEPPPAVAAPPRPARRGLLRRVLELFWRGRTLAEARAGVPARTAEQERLLQYARAATELGSRSLNPVDPLRAGNGVALSVALFREALDALESAFDGQRPPTPVASEDDAKRLAALLAPDALLARLRDGSTIGYDEARRLQKAVQNTLAQIDAPRRRVRRVVIQRFARVGVVLAAFAAVIVTCLLLVQRSLVGPDLAQGKPWTTSSVFASFSKDKGTLDGNKTTLLFHTRREQGPWIRFDLGSSVTIHQVEVVNRKDCCEDRAIPLIIEASPDGENWTEVIRRTETFGSWTAKFSPITARYVRLRVDKLTWFHLDEVHIR